MADYSDELVSIISILLAITLILIYFGYIWSIRKIYGVLGFNRKIVGLILLGILILGFVPLPVFPYNGWIVGLSIGGALIPIVVSVWLLRAKKLSAAEGFVGIVIVAFITFFITRVEEGVGIVADIELAFMPAIAAAMFSLSVFWQDTNKAAPLAFFSGTLGTIIGADIFRLAEILEFPPSPGGANFLVIGGANIFDMVFLTGIVAVALDLIVAYFHTRRGVMPKTTDELTKYQKDLIYEYEQRRTKYEKEIEKRSKYWERGVPYHPRYRIPSIEDSLGERPRARKIPVKYSATYRSPYPQQRKPGGPSQRMTMNQIEQLRRQMRREPDNYGEEGKIL